MYSKVNISKKEKYCGEKKFLWMRNINKNWPGSKLEDFKAENNDG